MIQSGEEPPAPQRAEAFALWNEGFLWEVDAGCTAVDWASVCCTPFWHTLLNCRSWEAKSAISQTQCQPVPTQDGTHIPPVRYTTEELRLVLKVPICWLGLISQALCALERAAQQQFPVAGWRLRWCVVLGPARGSGFLADH